MMQIRVAAFAKHLSLPLYEHGSKISEDKLKLSFFSSKDNFFSHVSLLRFLSYNYSK